MREKDNEEIEAENLTDLARIINANNNTDEIQKIIDENKSNKENSSKEEENI